MSNPSENSCSVIDHSIANAGTGLYVHVPFCLRKCLYCDFNSYALPNAAKLDYLQALDKEMAIYATQPSVQSARFTTMFVGGGTPTTLQSSDLVHLLKAAKSLARFGEIGENVKINDVADTKPQPSAEPMEITVEANPGTVNLEKLTVLRQAGVNRLSLGVQSCDDALLQVLGRAHTVKDAMQAFKWARQAEFKNINVDIMFALPGQSIGQFQDTVQRILELQPEHISCYSLIIEEGTSFGDRYAAGTLSLPGEDNEVAMYEWVIGRLGTAGYEHYEISNFALPGFRCKHNEIYWRNERYLGLGPGAHSYWQGERFANERMPSRYHDVLVSGQSPVVERSCLSLAEEMDETLMMGLRLLEGVSEARFTARFHCQMSEVYPTQIERLQQLGLIDYDGEVLRLTQHGLLLGNQVFAEFLR